VRGTPPTTEALIAAKHQSFLDIILIFNAVPHGQVHHEARTDLYPLPWPIRPADRLRAGEPRQARRSHRRR
jgi:1-acyl-sn-glycerol-3-phosphate acyltransferase